MPLLSTLSNYLERIVVIASNVSLIAIIVFVNIEVVTRYIFKSTWLWCEPFSKWLLPWLVFVSLGFVFKKKKHISVTFLVRKIIERWPNGFELYVCLGTLIFSLFLIWGGIVSVMHLQGSGILAVEYPFPRWIVYLSVPIGAALLIFHVIERIVKIMYTERQHNKTVAYKGKGE